MDTGCYSLMQITHPRPELLAETIDEIESGVLAAGQLSKSVHRQEGLRSTLGGAHASLSLKFLTNFIR